MSEIHFVFGAIALVYVALIWIIAGIVGFNNRGCTGACNQGRAQCDCQEARDA